MDLKSFLLKYSTINKTFLNEFTTFINEDTLDNDLVINIDMVIKWLEVRKGTIKTTLLRSYKLNVDYIITKIKISKSSGGSNNEHILITPDTFKRICLMTKSKKGDEGRTYYISLETLIKKYKTYIIKALNDKIGILENNQKPVTNVKGGVIYIIKAADDFEEVLYKVGKTNNIKARMSTYNTGVANNTEILFIYETDNVDRMEKCIKLHLQEYQYRKGKEIYKIDLEFIKEIIAECDVFNLILKNKAIKKDTDGSIYMVIDKKL